MSASDGKSTLAYDETVESAQFSLIEVTEDLLKQLVSEGRFVMKGSEDEEVVLCTKSSSFALREAPSSNSLLLLDTKPFTSDVDKHIVRKTLHGYYQLTRTQVNMEQLKNLIYQHPIENEDVHNERLYGSSKVLYTKKELEAKIQCSLSELETALSKLEVFELDGKLRVLSATTEHAIAKNIVLTINAEGLTLDSLNKDEVLAKCNQNSIFPQLFIDFVVHLYLRPSSTAMDVDSHSSKYSFDISRYNALSARLLLIEKPNWMLSELLSTWKDSVPDNFPIDVAQLDGLVCLEEYGKDHKVTYLPSFSLSHNPKTRFSELFKRKPKWTFGQLKPYLQDLVTPDINEEQLLVAHTRASTGPNGQKLYSAR